MGRAAKAKALEVVKAPAEPLKLDFGCGPHKREGFQGVDSRQFVGVDFLCDLTVAPWVFHGTTPAGCEPLGVGDAYLQSETLDYTATQRLPKFRLPDNSVSEAHASHFLEHLDAWQRVLFYNELWRVLIPNGTCQVIIPHWASCRAYGDPTHQWPPVSEFAWYYLSRDWRAGNAPHTDITWNPQGFTCHFDATWGYNMRPDLAVRNAEFQQFAMANHKEAITDMIATLKALK